MLITMIVAIGILALLLSLGVITAPVPNLVKPTTTPRQYGGTMKSALLGPLPVRIAATGANGPKIAMIERSDGANKNRGFWGIAITSGIDVGSALDEEPNGSVSDCIIDGYAGVVPQSYVWVDPGAMPNPLAGWSGLTHVDPADGTPPIGVGVTTTKIYVFPLRGGVDFHA